MTDEEQYLREQLKALHRSYMEAAKPFIDRLNAIEACKPLMFTIDQLDSIRAKIKGMEEL